MKTDWEWIGSSAGKKFLVCALVQRMTRLATMGPLEVWTVQLEEGGFSLMSVEDGVGATEEMGVHEWIERSDVVEESAREVSAVHSL